MARILFLTELLPYPLVSGAKIRAYYVLRHLAARHQVTLLTFVRDDDPPAAVAHLASFLQAVETVPMVRSPLRDIRAAVAGLVSGQPALIAREKIRAMHQSVRRHLESGDFDVVHADQIPMAQYGLIKAGPRPVWRVLDQHNATFQILERMARGGAWWKRLLLNREARAFARYEAAVCQRYDRVTFVTDTDRTAMVRLVKDGTFPDRTSVIPICVDTDSVPALAPVERPFRVTHVGTMYWPPNVDGLSWFWQSVWPRVLAEAPEARLTLIGKRPPDHIRQWDRAPDVDVLGYVEDLDPYLRQTAVFVVPLHAAGGMRVKIVDAWCWGLPIVATTIGAEGIAVRDGENILIADDPGAFARAIVRVMAEPVLQQSLRTAGRAWVEQQYDWRQRYVGFDRVYGDLLNRTAAEVRS